MGTASASFEAYPIPLDGDARTSYVARLDRTQAAGERLSVIPNVRCLRVEFHEGAKPPAARFEYVFDDNSPQSWPDQFEEVWPLDSDGPFVVQNDDELCVFVNTSDPSIRRLIFSGFAQIPQTNLSESGQSVTFTAVGTPVRCFDMPIQGRIQRNADLPESMDAVDQRPTNLPVQFNPDKKSNMTFSANDVNESDPMTSYPVFMDENIIFNTESWTLGGAVRYLLSTQNVPDSTFTPPVQWVRNPLFNTIDTTFIAYDQAALPGAGAAPIVLRDYDATNKLWPDAIEELLGYYNFAFRWRLTQDGNDEPVWTIRFYRKDKYSLTNVKSLSLQQFGASLDPGQTNVQGISAVFDSNAIINAYIIETRPILYEISVILAPDFAIVGADAAAETDFDYAKVVNTINWPKYRRYIADEAGISHWDYTTAALVVDKPLDLLTVLGKDRAANPQYTRRLRPGKSTVISSYALDGPGHHKKAELAVGWAYTGKCPALWDRSQTDWVSLGSSGWKLLDDRLGIEITTQSLNGWHTPKGAEGKNGRQIYGVTAQAAPTAAIPRFYLRLTTVIEGDFHLAARATNRAASPTKFPVTRRIDCRDHFKLWIVDTSSAYNTTGADVIDTDDTAKAVAHAEGLRAAHEFPPLAGTIKIPVIVQTFEIGDRIDNIDGREVSFRTNAAAEQNEAPFYPSVVGISWNLSPEQSTDLILSDRRAELQRA